MRTTSTPESRRQPLPYKSIGIFVLGVLCAVGLITLVTHDSAVLPFFKPSPHKSAAPAAQGSNGAQIAPISGATFKYLVPESSDNWVLNTVSQAFDSSRGVAKYIVLMKPSNVNITVSQQAMPQALLPRGSDAFSKFIAAAKVTHSQDLTNGSTIYFLPGLQNGVLANGTDTIIYATDQVLLFGRAESIVGYPAWVKFVDALQEHS